MKEHGDNPEGQLRLYSLLVDQIHKYATIFWQFPTALLAANAFAIDKFLNEPPGILFGVALVDLALIYAFHRLILYQRAIIKAAKKAEIHFRRTQLKEFVPNFPRFSRFTPRATGMLLLVLYAAAISLLGYSVIPILCFMSGRGLW